MAEIENLKIGANGTIHIVGNENIITEEWEASKTYVKDKSYVIREHKLYVCNITHTSTSSFDPTKWTEITVIGAIDNALDMTDTASGAIATFESEYALPLRDLEIEINAVQESGTPTPSSPKAISGFTGADIAVKGANLFSLTQDTIRSDRQGSLSACTITDTSVTATSTANNYACFGRYLFLPKGAYTIKFQATSSEVGYTPSITIYRDGTTVVKTNIQPNTPTTFTLTDDKIIEVRMFVTYSNDANIRTVTFSDIQIEKGNSVSETYTPYVSNITAISWQDEAGTVYGGSLDVTSGKLTVTWTKKLMSTWAWSYNDADYSYGFFYLSSNISDKASNFNIICDCLQSNSIGRNALSNNELGAWNNTGNINRLCARADSITDLTAWNTFIADKYVCYELATPVTYQLTPTQISAIVGTNNVFTDTNGDTSLEYYTKRGEQTVRIAEGVAVDVINNKSIDTLATTDKTVKGAINELAADKFDSANRVSTGSGTFVGLLNTGDRVWLIIAQRLSTNSTIVLVAHKQGSSYYFKEIVKDSGMAYNYNQDNGSVVITYGGQTTGVYGGAYRLV